MAYRARKREDLLRAMDDFFSGAFVIPPGQWDPAIRLEPPQHVQSRVRLSQREPRAAPLCRCADFS